MSFETFNFDDVVDDETYETLKWMAKRKIFSCHSFFDRYGDPETAATFLQCLVLQRFVGIKNSNGNYLENHEVINMEASELQNTTAVTTPALRRYVQRRNHENWRWYITTAIAVISLIIGLYNSFSPAKATVADVNIISWPATAESAQQLVTQNQ